MDVYFDYAATTPLDPLVLEVMLLVLGGEYGNPASLHRVGQRARGAVETARERLASAIGARPRELTFTSGATEADNHALRAYATRFPGGHIVTSRLEHTAVLSSSKHLGAQGWRVTYLEPDARGEITPEAVASALRPNTFLVALMLVNNETGVVTDIPAISRVAHEAGAVLFCDAVQAFGVMPVDVGKLGADMLALSAHKVYGPKGVGALYVRSGLELPPFMLGGEQERGLRAGTLNVPAIVGFGKAAELAQERLETDAPEIARLRDGLEAKLLKIDGVALNAPGAPRSAKHLNVRIAGVDGEDLLMGLDAAGVCASAGSACAAGTLEPSHVLLAMGLSHREAKASIRLSLGRGVTDEMVDYAAKAFAEVVERSRLYAA
jgi:cysteine desulfurase